MEKIKHKPYGPYEKYIKRPLDLICSLIAIIVFSWLYLIIAILVRVKLGSPVIFTQDRPGKDEKIFKLYKFRTMTDEKDESGNLLPDSERLTQFGKILRATSLDELPEAFNIAKGDMSIVGTRPPLISETNSHPYDSGLIIADNSGAVEQWLTKEDERPEFYQNRVNAGLHVVSPEILAVRPEGAKVDLDRQLLKPLAGTGKMFCYDSPEYVKDMGTPDRYEAVCKDFADGVVTGKNLKRKQKAIFLDRDGTINKYVGFLRSTDEFELLPGVAEAIGKINRSGYLAIVVTNQPVIARGEVSWDKLQDIHNKMETLLGLDGVYLDGIYFCPHHPHMGYEGEVSELKFDCDCRKPKPGMLLKAAENFNVSLKDSWMIGDGENDVKAGQAAGCKTALIGEGEFGQNLTENSLLELVDEILK